MRAAPNKHEQYELFNQILRFTCLFVRFCSVLLVWFVLKFLQIQNYCIPIEINRGALLQNGIKLPCIINVDGDNVRAAKKISKIISAGGFDIKNTKREKRYILNVALLDNAARVELLDTQTSRRLYAGSISIADLKSKNLYKLAEDIQGEVFVEK
jgi:hypothetical protein